MILFFMTQLKRFLFQYNQGHLSKKMDYSGKPGGSWNNLPELPNLPDDENLSTPDVSDDGMYFISGSQQLVRVILGMDMKGHFCIEIKKNMFRYENVCEIPSKLSKLDY